MRIDKYLWAIRMFKTRSIATDEIKKGHIKVNNTAVKASKEVFIGDKILVKKKQIPYQIEVLDIPPNRVGPKLVDLYRKDHTPASAFEKNELLQFAKDYYRKKGVGRPSKKDRRDIEDYTNNDLDDKEIHTEDD